MTRAFLLLGFAGAYADTLPAQANPAAAVQGAAISWYINSQLSGNSPQIAIICVGTGKPRKAKDAIEPMNTGGDVSDAVLAAVVKSTIPLRSLEECTSAPTGSLRTVERGTGRPAVSILIGPPAFDAPDRASVLLDVRLGARNGGGWNCFAVHDKGRWRIDECMATWIS